MSFKDAQGEFLEIQYLQEEENSQRTKHYEKEKGLWDWISLKEMIEKSYTCFKM